MLCAFFLIPAACGREKDPAVAKVGSLSISQSEFRRKLADVAEGYQNYLVTPSGRRQFLDVLVREKLIISAAMRSGIAQTEEFKAEMARLKEEEEIRLREGRDYLLTRFWLEDLRQKGVLKATDDDAREYHRKYPLEVQISHILLATPEEAESAAKKTRAGGAFAAAAKSLSLDSSTAIDGGRMQPAIYGEIIPDLEDVVFRLRNGEIGGPIKSKFGYHVLRKDSERTLPFEEARPRILRLLEKQKLDKYLESIQKNFPVEVVDEQFK